MVAEVNFHSKRHWAQYARNAAMDFGVGALSSGVAGLSKVAILAKMAGYTNNRAVKGLTAEVSEGAKGFIDGTRPLSYGIAGVAAGALNSSGAVGKVAGYIAKKTGAVVDGFVPAPSIAALLQPRAIPATAPAAAAAITEGIGAIPNYSLQHGATALSSSLGSSSSASGTRK